MIKINFNSKPGFSILEMLIVFAIILVLLDAVWTFYKNTIDTNNILTDNLNSQFEVRNSFEKISANIRSASPSSLGAYTIYGASSTSFSFYSDVDNDGIRERVRYFLSGNTLREGVIKPSGNPLVYNTANEKITYLVHNIINNASSSRFSYYDENYDGTTASLATPIDILKIRLFKIKIKVDSDPSRPPGPVEFTTQVSIRNLKDNY
jgi:type II secretory pathway pseudopilin PulG